MNKGNSPKTARAERPTGRGVAGVLVTVELSHQAAFVMWFMYQGTLQLSVSSEVSLQETGWKQESEKKLRGVISLRG